VGSIGIVAVLIAGLLGLLYVGASHYYVISPGNAPVVSASSQCRSVGGGSFALPDGAPCVQLVLPAGRAAPVQGSIMMVDVEEGKPSLVQFALYKLGLLERWDDGSQLLPDAEITGPLSASQLACEDTEQMTDATSAASVAALRRLGYQVTQDDLGAQIDGVVSGSPAAAAGVRCGDLVTGLNSTPIRTAQGLVDAIHAVRPGSVVRIVVSRPAANGGLERVTLSARLSGTPAAYGEPAQPGQAFLGVANTETRTTYKFPFPVSVQVGAIGGPSAGLALTLGLIDSLSGGHLTGGLRVAATGTIDVNGDVGDVGGVAQKAVAVRDAGAKIFLVPVQEYAAARSEAGSMKVFAVSTLSQALSVLESQGGRAPATGAGGA
jgi:PDZ domain-containing protein